MDPGANEIDEGSDYVGYQEALDLVCSNVKPVGIEEISLEAAVGRIAAEDRCAQVRYPSSDISLKDGFAVRPHDVARASKHHPVSLKIIGSAFAGTRFDSRIEAGQTIKVCSGATVPAGAESVVSGEFCQQFSEEVHITANAEAGRNILHAGREVESGALVIKASDMLLPGQIGLAATAGINTVKVYRRPVAALVGIGDEIVLPGARLHPGQVYASNLITLKAWLNSFGIECIISTVEDSAKGIKHMLEEQWCKADVILTSGGALGSERDLVVGTLDGLGWQEIFHHVRMGPGKGAVMGILKDKPVFCLPGGPASNTMAFLQLALPGILRMSGDKRHPLQSVSARLSESIKGRHSSWTEFRNAKLTRETGGVLSVSPYRSHSRLQAIARADCLICVPEGIESVSAGSIVPVQILVPRNLQ